MSGELIDIGSNLTHDSFAADLPQVIRRAIEAGVTRQIVTGADLDSSRAAAALAAAHPSTLWSTAGIHPHHAAQFDPARREELEELLREPRVVAVGECGLDYFRDFSPRAAQRSAFIAQLELAASCAQAGVSPPARRARGFRGHSRRAPSAAWSAGWRTASPAVRASSRITSSSIYRSGSRDGSAMSAAASSCAALCRASPRRASCWRPMHPTSCRAISSRGRHRAAMSPPSCPTSRARSRSCAANLSNCWPKRRRETPSHSSG